MRNWALASAARVFAVLAAGSIWLAASGPAEAAWRRAETERFIVFGDASEDEVREYAVKLTTFDAVLRALNPAVGEAPVGRKLEVYLVRGRQEMRRIRPDMSSTIRGFYVGNNEAVFAAVSTVGPGVDADQVLFHEYAHHFMLENFPAAYPAWFVEGWAEYFMTTQITPQTITVGGYNRARVQWLAYGDWMPLELLLTRHLGQLSDGHQNVFYSQAWHLMHYMRSSPERAAQLNKAILAISRGEEPLAAFKSATGLTPKELEKELEKYRQLPLVSIENKFAAPAITVTTLPASADDLLLENLRLMTSPYEEPDEKLLGQIRKKAARYPGDRLAQMTLARAEFTYGDVAAGDAIMEALIAAEPNDVDALVLAGVGKVLAGYRDESRKAEHFRAARRHFTRAYELDKNDFRSLYHYARSRSIEAAYPNENDVAALLEARALAPSVQEIAYHAGEALVRRGRTPEATAVLTPLLNWPHGGAPPLLAKALLEGKSYDEAVAAAEAGADQAQAKPETERRRPSTGSRTTGG